MAVLPPGIENDGLPTTWNSAQGSPATQARPMVPLTAEAELFQTVSGRSADWPSVTAPKSMRMGRAAIGVEEDTPFTLALMDGRRRLRCHRC